MADLLTSNVPLAPTAKTTETALPDWYTNYAMQVLANQQALSAQPYTAYQGPRIADFTPMQQQAFTQAQNAATAYKPGLQQAFQTAQSASGMSAAGAAQPYMQQAGQLAPSMINTYMNPYMDSVVNRMGELGARTLREQLLPEIGDQFVRAGQYGGSRQAEAIGKAVRDVAESTQAKQAELLASGYGNAMSSAQADLARLSQLGATAGNLGQADIASRQASADLLAKLAGQEQNLGLAGAGALQTMGQQQQALGQANLELAYQDFLRQQGYTQQQIDNMTKTLGGVAGAVPKSVLETGYGPVSANDLTKSTNTLQNIANLLTSAAPFFTGK